MFRILPGAAGARQNGPVQTALRRAGARELLIIVAYLAIVIGFTWPGVTHVFNRFGSLDPTNTAWNLWWVKQQLFAVHNPWHTDYMFAPVGTWLAFHTLTPLAGVLLSPLTAAIGAGPTANLTKFITPVISSYAAYRLALRVGLGRPASFLVGLLYGCSPALIWRADGHFNFASGAIFPPLVLLCSMRLRSSRSRRDAALLGAALGAALLIDQTFFLFSVGILAAYFGAAGWLEDRQGRMALLRGVGLAFLVGLVIASPQLWMMARQIGAGEFSSKGEPIGQSWVTYGAAPATLLAPSSNFETRTGIHFGLWAHEEGEGLSSYGLGLLILATAGALLAFRRRLTKWLIALWLALTVLALGPTLVIGHHVWTPLPIHSHGVDLSLLMPYTYLVHVPGLSDLRVAARFALLALLPLALLAGLGIQQLALRRGGLGWGVLGVGLAIAVLELGGPIRYTGPLYFDRLYAPVKADHSHSIVVDLPLTWASGILGSGHPLDRAIEASESMPLLRATQHGHPVAYGFAARISQDQLAELSRHRFYSDLLRLQGHSVYAVPVPRRVDPRRGAADARRMDVGWVTVWPDVSRRVVPYLRAAGFDRVASQRGARLFGRR